VDRGAPARWHRVELEGNRALVEIDGETTLRDLPVDVTVQLVEGATLGTLWRGTRPESLTVTRPDPEAPKEPPVGP
jgi:hypothetical protein